MEGLALMTHKFDGLDRLVKVTRAAEVERVKAGGQYGVILNFQNTTHFGLDLSALDLFYDLGVRIMWLADHP